MARSCKLYGLDSTISQAFLANIGLHSFSYALGARTEPFPICNTRDGPTVSPGFLQQLEL
jgi:hypothetical protein